MKCSYQLFKLLVVVGFHLSTGEYCTNRCGGGNNTEYWCGQQKTINGKLSKCSEYSHKGVWCLNTCEKRGEKYFWCQTGHESRIWDYCAPKQKTIYGNDCKGRCMRGKDYYYCYIDDDKNWDYCSPEARVQTQ